VVLLDVVSFKDPDMYLYGNKHVKDQSSLKINIQTTIFTVKVAFVHSHIYMYMDFDENLPLHKYVNIIYFCDAYSTVR
jgi:hypothetical protein